MTQDTFSRRTLLVGATALVATSRHCQIKLIC